MEPRSWDVAMDDLMRRYVQARHAFVILAMSDDKKKEADQAKATVLGLALEIAETIVTRPHVLGLTE